MVKKILQSHHPLRHAKSFKFAFSGIVHTMISEPNFRIQILLTGFSVFLGLHYNISYVEWGLLILSLGFLLSAELLNTVVEIFIDELIREYHNGAKIIKDVSAGFVLITGITFLLIFLLVFGHRILGLF